VPYLVRTLLFYLSSRQLSLLLVRHDPSRILIHLVFLSSLLPVLSNPAQNHPKSPSSCPNLCPSQHPALDTHSLVFQRPKSLTVPSWATLLTSEGRVAVAIFVVPFPVCELTREKEPKYGNDLGREKRWFVERRARSRAKGEGVAGEVGLTGRSISSLSSPAHAHSTEPERPRRERELALNREKGDRARESLDTRRPLSPPTPALA
jgi:hypothetical protein